MEQNTDINIDVTKVDPSYVTKPVRVKITVLGDWLPSHVTLTENNVEIRPRALAERAFKELRVNGDKKTIEFVITEPANLVVDVNGYPNVPETNDHHSMCLFANPPLIGEFAPPSAENGANIIYIEPGEGPLPNVQAGHTLYFKPGVHKIPEDSPLTAGVNYYIPGGAYVQGTFKGEDKSNIKFWGYGIISGKDIPSIRASGSPPIMVNNWGGGVKNFVFQGITFEDAPYHTINVYGGTREQPLRFINYKTTNWKPNTDAHSSGGFVLVDHCFFRCQDDDIYVAGSRQGAVIRRTAFWNDANACAFLFTSSGGGGNVAIEDCNVIRNNSFILNGKLGNVFNIRSIADNQTIDNVHFKNIRIEDYRKLLFRFDLDDLPFAKPVGVVLRGDISFKNFTVDHYHRFYTWREWQGKVSILHQDQASILHGSLLNHCTLFNIFFENVIFEGREADNSDFDIQNAAVIVQRSSGESLPVAWLDQEISLIPFEGLKGSAYYAPPEGVEIYPDKNTKGIFTITGSGNTNYASDHCHMAYKRVDIENGACIVMANVNNRSSKNMQAGLMLRDRLDPVSPSIAILWGPGDDLYFYQWSANGEMVVQGNGQPITSDSVYLKIARNHDTYTTAYSLSGKESDWHPLGLVTATMNSERLYFCLVASSDNESTLSSTDFSQVTTIPKMMEY